LELLSEPPGLSVAEAFTRAAGYARRMNRKLTDVAQDMLVDPNKLTA
jgi:hypothetical protein